MLPVMFLAGDRKTSERNARKKREEETKVRKLVFFFFFCCDVRRRCLAPLNQNYSRSKKLFISIQNSVQLKKKHASRRGLQAGEADALFSGPFEQGGAGS